MNQELVGRIAEEADLDEEEIEEEIDEKIEEFSGMVSEEGAVHLVAKEHGIELENRTQDLDVENVVPDMRNVSLKARVTSIMEPNTFEQDDGEGKVQNIVLADETGSIRMSLWNEQTEIAEKIEEGDALEIKSAYTVEDNRGNAELRLGDSSQVKMADEDEVPEVESGVSEAEEVPVREVTDEGARYAVEGMIIDVYTSNPFYRVDPETGETLREEDGEYVTETGDVIEEPDHRLVLPAVLDDGTGNVRVIFFRDRARELLEIDEETEREGDSDAVEEAAGTARGKILRVEGRTRYNDYFGRIELIANGTEEVDVGEKLEETLEELEA